MSETNVLIFALLGGILPALFWLWFWIREDRLKPEPKGALLSAFIGGIIAVLLALFFELIIYYLLVDANLHSLNGFPNILKNILQNITTKYNLIQAQTDLCAHIQGFFNDFSSHYLFDAKKILLVVIIAPITEEFLKLILTYNICLRRKVNDEPIDASIYMLTAALGFAAVETAIFLTTPFSNGHITDALFAGGFRSIGPMLIHLICSAIIGLFIGLAFYKNKITKFVYLVLGLFVAISLHAVFNFFIVLNDITHNTTFFWTACLGTWALIVVLLVLFEKVKNVVRKSNFMV